jgi:hypothetical protein
VTDEGRVREWAEISEEALDPSSISRLYAGRGPHRVSTSWYPAGSSFRGSTRSATAYVFAGSCRYEFEGGSVELRGGQFAELPAGEYAFEVLGGEPVLVVRVWKLPDSIFT